MRTPLAMMIALATLGACDAYDRDIGPAPFLCGPAAKRCPADYTCIEDPNTGDEICVMSDSLSSAIDCADDSAVEPNDVLDDATPMSGGTLAREGLAICPPTDRDTFEIPITGATAIELEVVLDRGATLRAEILNAGGVPIATGSLDDATRTLTAIANGLEPGTYFARVSSPAQRSNNYSITIRTH
jgi:hypothetical protein